jgi:SnoaL-like domain
VLVGAPRVSDPRRTLPRVEIYCADCGCLVERGVRVVPCNSAECCCVDLPIRLRTIDQIADQLRSAFATKDLATLGRLLADDARWGDDDHPNKCRSRSDVIATFDRLLGEGVDGEVTETIVGPNGIAVLLHVCWPNPGEGRGVNFYQAYLVHNGLVTEIQRYDDRTSALAALSL